MSEWRTQRAQFIPSPPDQATEIVCPKFGFSQLGIWAAVTDDRHDVPADRAPAWFVAGVLAACEAASVEPYTRNCVVARRIGSAGKYRFWTSPAGMTGPEWVAACEAATAERAVRDAAWLLASCERKAAALLAQCEKIVAWQGWVSVGTRPSTIRDDERNIELILMHDDGRTACARIEPQLRIRVDGVAT